MCILCTCLLKVGYVETLIQENVWIFFIGMTQQSYLAAIDGHDVAHFSHPFSLDLFFDINRLDQVQGKQKNVLNGRVGERSNSNPEVLGSNLSHAHWELKNAACDYLTNSCNPVIGGSICIWDVLNMKSSIQSTAYQLDFRMDVTSPNQMSRTRLRGVSS